MPSPLDSVAGRFGAGKASRPVTRRVYQEALRMYRAGEGTTAIRASLHARGKTDPLYKTSNGAISGLVKEFKEVVAKRSSAGKISGQQRPGPKTVIKSGMTFGHKFMYYGEAHIWQLPEEGERDYEEDEEGEEDEDGGVSGSGEPFEVVPLGFGDDERLTVDMIEAKLFSMGEQIARRGGTNRANYQNGLYAHHAVVTSIQQSA